MARTSRKTTRGDWAERLRFQSVLLGRSTTLFRNLRDAFFPDRLSADDLKRLRDRLCAEIVNTPRVLGRQAFALTDEHNDFVQEIDRLSGYGLVSPAFLAHGAGAAIVAAPGGVSISVNDEDHLTFSVSEAASFAGQWKRVSGAAETLGKRIPYAYNPTYGFLSANPEHVGIGIRLSGTFCLFGLFLMKELEPVLHGLERLGFATSPMFVLSEQEENPLDAPGCCYRFHSTQMVGEVAEVIRHTEHVFAEIARQEEHARLRLRAQRPDVLHDFVLRSVGAGSLGVQVAESEGVDMVCAMILGLDMGVLDAETPDLFRELHMILPQITGPGIRQMVAAGGDEPDALPEGRRLRAGMIRRVAMRMLPACLDKISSLSGRDTPRGVGNGEA